MPFDTTDDLVRHINAQHEEVLNLTKEEAAKAASKLEGLDAEVLEIQQRLARRGGGGSEVENSGQWIGQQVVDSDAFKALIGPMNSKGRVAVPVKNMTTAAGSGGALIAPDRRTDVGMLPKIRPFVRSLLAPGRTSSDLVEYPRQTGFTNNADAVSEGTLKPESNITFELKDAKVKTIAHWIPASKQVLSDSGQLVGLIDGEMRYGLAIEEEQQILFGDGSGESIEGIVPQATAFSPAFAVANHTRLDDLLLGIAQAHVARYPATGIVVNDLDWFAMMALKDGEGRYIGGGPFGGQINLAWQVPVIPTPTMPSGKFLTGAFSLGAQIFDRWDASVEISTEDRDNFVKNMVTILAEERLALAVKRPEAFVYGSYSVVSGS